MQFFVVPDTFQVITATIAVVTLWHGKDTELSNHGGQFCLTGLCDRVFSAPINFHCIWDPGGKTSEKGDDKRNCNQYFISSVTVE